MNSKVAAILVAVCVLPVSGASKFCFSPENSLGNLCGDEKCTESQCCSLKVNGSDYTNAKMGCIQKCPGVKQFGCPDKHICCNDIDLYCCKPDEQCGGYGSCQKKRDPIKNWNLGLHFPDKTNHADKDKNTKPKSKPDSTLDLGGYKDGERDSTLDLDGYKGGEPDSTMDLDGYKGWDPDSALDLDGLYKPPDNDLNYEPPSPDTDYDHSSSYGHTGYVAGGSVGGGGFIIICCFCVRFRRRRTVIRRGVIAVNPTGRAASTTARPVTSRPANATVTGRPANTNGGPGTPVCRDGAGRVVPVTGILRVLTITRIIGRVPEPDPEAVAGQRGTVPEPPSYSEAAAAAPQPGRGEQPPAYSESDPAEQSQSAIEMPPYSDFTVESDRKQLCEEAE